MGKETVIRPKQLVVSTQTFVLSLLNAGHLTDYELLNLDTLNNAVHSLRQMGAIYYEVRWGRQTVKVIFCIHDKTAVGIDAEVGLLSLVTSASPYPQR